jgi:transcriptional regulator with XRE-family HTH domain
VSLAAAVADEVRRRMTARDMSQNELARAAGMPPTLLHRAVKHERALQLDEVEALARVLDVSAEWLLSSAIRTWAKRHPPSGERSEPNEVTGQE